jgi:membrane-bound metal-dependent hydrolase YbcI (DUF457 family)
LYCYVEIDQQFRKGIMPVTPFHLGPGIAFKLIASRHVSFTIFAFTQILIDLEAFYYFAQNDGHMHRHLHTFLGAAIVAGVGVVVGRPLCQWLLKLWNSHLSPVQKRWLYVEPQIFSHILLDSIMHGDMQPFLPFSDKNGLYHILTLDQLDMLCVVSGFVGLLILAGLFLLRKRQKTVLDSD